MGFWFFKQLFYIFKRNTKHILLLLFLFFLIYLFLFTKHSFALSDLYGNYHGFSASDINSINTLISQYKGNYDSFICRYLYNSGGDTSLISIFFYNEDTTGRLYKSDITSTQYPHSSFRVYSENTATDSVTYYSFKYNDFSYINTGTRNNIDGLETGNITGNKSDFCIYTNRNIYTSNSYNTIAFNGGDITILSPYITTPNSTIINWTFSNLTINGSSLSSDYSHSLRYTYPDSNTSYELNIDSYYTINNNTLIFNIPRSVINQDIVVRNGSTINFSIISRMSLEGGQSILVNDLGAYTLDLTAQAQQEINEDSDKQLLSDIKNEQQKTTDSINDLHNELLDTTTPTDNEFDLPSIEVNDITSNFFNTLFTNLYNAITSAEDTTITINIFSHTYTISSSQFNFLTDSRFNVLSTFLTFSWYGSIGFYVIYDIRKMITKIKQGNIENITNNDIQANSV